MKKKAFIELIQTQVAGGAVPADLESRLHPLVIGAMVDVVYESIIYKISGNALRYRDWGQLDQYCRPYKNVAILKDEDRNEWYSILPASVIQLPRNRGIHQISPMKDQVNKFKYSDNNSVDIWDELEAQKVVDYTSFYVESNRVYYRKFDENYVLPGLLFKLLTPLSEFDDDDEIGIPGEKSIDIFTFVTELLTKRAPETNTNENDSKQI